MPNALLTIENLQTHFFTPDGVVRAVNDVTLEIQPKQTLGLVGESGCGKSVTAHSILRLLPKNSKIVQGKILFRRRGQDAQVDLARVDPSGDLIREIRGNEIAMVFQEPMTSLSPVHTIGEQIEEAIRLHQGASKAQARERAIDILEKVGFAGAAGRLDNYPHQLSGGLRQRVMIAMALSCNPSLLIADEPTTALDVTIQAQILDLLKTLQEQFQMAILLITHNLGVIAEMADHVAVMYMGRVVESGDARTIFHRPLHPYTVGLMKSTPRLADRARDDLMPIPGSVPDPFSVPVGCAFYPRCRAAKRDSCRDPAGVPLTEVEPGHFVRCTLYE
ncbi:MAG: ABC transporter ATP-binding protein [Chloroflexota bacterium]